MTVRDYAQQACYLGDPAHRRFSCWIHSTVFQSPAATGESVVLSRSARSLPVCGTTVWASGRGSTDVLGGDAKQLWDRWKLCQWFLRSSSAPCEQHPKRGPA